MNTVSAATGQNNEGVTHFRARLVRRLRREGLDKDRVDDVVSAEQSVWSVLFDHSRDGIVIINEQGHVVDANPAFAALLGYSLDEILRFSVYDWDAQYNREQIAGMLATIDKTGAEVESRFRCSDGRFIDVEMSNNGIVYDGEKLIFCICRDVTQRKEYERRINQMATTDALTGLLNRREFSIRLNQALASAQDSELTLILFDVDYFKSINDRFGHAVGDQVLMRIATQVQRLVRATDSVARWGGEEFVILLPGVNSAQAAKIADNMRQAIAQLTFENAGQVTASFGVAPKIAGDNSASLIRRADHAMYEAKGAGRNCVQLLNDDNSGPVCCP